MEEQKRELEVLKDTIFFLNKTIDIMKDCESITELEYQIAGAYLEELQDRAMKLRVELNSYTMEEI